MAGCTNADVAGNTSLVLPAVGTHCATVTVQLAAVPAKVFHSLGLGEGEGLTSTTFLYCGSGFLGGALTSTTFFSSCFLGLGASSFTYTTFLEAGCTSSAAGGQAQGKGQEQRQRPHDSVKTRPHGHWVAQDFLGKA